MVLARLIAWSAIGCRSNDTDPTWRFVLEISAPFLQVHCWRSAQGWRAEVQKKTPCGPGYEQCM